MKRLLPWLLIGCCGIATLSVFLLITNAFQKSDLALNQLLSDPTNRGQFAAFGDGAHVYTITPDMVHLVGDSVLVGNLRISVLEAAPIEAPADLRSPAQRYEYLQIMFTIKNTSDEVTYPHPSVDSQIQFLVRESYTWRPANSDKCVPPVNDGITPLEPLSEYLCSLTYEVPQDDHPIYWVYKFHENLAVFQVR